MKLKLNTFGAINITGPKWCGKTSTAERVAKSAIYLHQYHDKGELEMLSSTYKVSQGAKGRDRSMNGRMHRRWGMPFVTNATTPVAMSFHPEGSTSRKVKTAHPGPAG